jgi:hypothetical protein
MKNARHRKPLVVMLGIPRVKQGNRSTAVLTPLQLQQMPLPRHQQRFALALVRHHGIDRIPRRD